MSPATVERILSFSWAPFVAVVPLAAGLVAVCVGKYSTRLAIPSTALGLLVASLTCFQVSAIGPVEHEIGGWAAPLGIKFRVDGLSAAFLITTAIIAAAVALFSGPVFGKAPESETRAGFAFWPLLYFMWAGLNAVFVSGDLFNLYVALELLTLTAVSMVCLDGRAESFAAAIRYLLFALLGSLAYLLGVAFLYSAYGVLDIRLMRIATPNNATMAAGALMTAGLMAKSGLFPLHAWLPPAQAAAPAPASAMLSALVEKAPFYVIARLWFDVLPSLATVEATQFLGALGAGGILFGSLLALRQEGLKLIIAYSTIAQLGYLLLMFPLALGAEQQQTWAATAWSGGIFHALAHAPAKAAMFLSAGLMTQSTGGDRIESLIGVAHRLPIAAFAFGLASVSLMGLPPSGGFTAKYLLLTSAFASGQWWWATAIIAGGLLAAAYLFRVLNRFLIEPEEAPPRAPACGGQFVALFLAGLSILLGLFSIIPYDLLQIGRVANVEVRP